MEGQKYRSQLYLFLSLSLRCLFYIQVEMSHKHFAMFYQIVRGPGEMKGRSQKLSWFGVLEPGYQEILYMHIDIFSF